MSEDVFFTDITQNNLKHLDFKMTANEMVVVSGVSGSGKSTLINQVIAAEALRQQQMRNKSDKIIHYAVRPEFNTCSSLPDPIIISQRSAHVAENIRFGTRTRINELLVKYFVEAGQIVHQQHSIVKQSLPEIFAHQQRFYANSSLFLRVINFEPLSANLRQQLVQQKINSLLLRAEGKPTLKATALSILPAPIEKYEGFIAINNEDEAEQLKSINAVPVLMLDSRGVEDASTDEYDHDEIEFDRHGFAPEQRRIFRLPSQKLFSRATQSSTAGYCRQCDGSREQISYNLDSVIITDVPLTKEFLNVEKTKAGRYQGFKFLPSGLTTVLKKAGVDVTLSFDALPAVQRDIVLNTLRDKLASNSKDKFAQTFIKQGPCAPCQGSGFGWQARAVKVNGYSLHEYLAMNGQQLHQAINEIKITHPLLTQLKHLLQYLHALAIEHISFERPLTTLSSGELQRMKLLPALVEEVSQRLFIIDEPSSNLQYKDNLSIIELLKTIKGKGNRILLVEHNPLYQVYADRVFCIGPKAGAGGGDYCQAPTIEQQLQGLSISSNIAPVDTLEQLNLALQPTRHMQLTQLSLPKNTINTVIGASGSGKSTLCREMLYPALTQQQYTVELLDSRPFAGASNSIVATYLGVFDDLRQFFAAQSQGQYTVNDFSFNAGGACEHCDGKGVVEIGSGRGAAKDTVKQTCPMCFGSRFRAEIALFHAEIDLKPATLPQVLTSDFTWISAQAELAKLHATIATLEALSLGHLHLGRETQTLSGGELQRLKLARFLLNHWLNGKSTPKRAADSQQQVVILDEPCRGLDSQAVTRLVGILRENLAHSTLIVIEHNPYFIYQSDYIVDLGCSGEQKTAANIYQADLHSIQVLDLQERLLKFPSLNHEQVMEQAKTQMTDKAYQTKQLKDKSVLDSTQSVANTARVNSTGRHKERYQLIPQIYRQQINFEREHKFRDNFEVVVPDDNCFFYRDWKTLQSAVLAKQPQAYFYNPFMRQLERYSKVPLSERKKLLAAIPAEAILHQEDDWHCLVATDSVASAYLQGAGVVIIRDRAETLSYHSIRLFSLKEKVVDRVFPQKFAFNLYKNACQHCNGYGKFLSYPLQEWVDETKSILDKGALPFPLEKSLSKRTIIHFAQKEGLFDFGSKIQTLNLVERNILFYGFKAYRFQKPNAKNTADYQYYEWEGLNSYIYDNRKQLSASRLFVDEVHWINCPFCTHGFSSKIKYYQCKGEKFIDIF
ncbi:ATP-binding cassette domain-containing protein [uncultured Shewanella sp.]|uniref:ATP-binding cassette domain-containing protein n=1 Tax=uncultured Shewanella sp. TaxID=173975 RepID=UPI0037049AC6